MGIHIYVSHEDDIICDIVRDVTMFEAPYGKIFDFYL